MEQFVAQNPKIVIWFFGAVVSSLVGIGVILLGIISFLFRSGVKQVTTSVDNLTDKLDEHIETSNARRSEFEQLRMEHSFFTKGFDFCPAARAHFVKNELEAEEKEKVEEEPK